MVRTLQIHHIIRRTTPPARLAAILLLLVWVGPVTFDQIDAWRLLRLAGAPQDASAESKTLSAGEAIVLTPGTQLKLNLRDGSTVQGRFLGRALLDSSVYVPRFYRHSQWMPFIPGEVVHVSLRDGRELAAPFAGYAELALLLQSPDSAQPVRVPFEFTKQIRRVDGDRVEPRDLTKAFRKRWLPSADALLLGGTTASVNDPSEGALRIPAEDINTASLDLPSGSPGSSVAGGILLGVMVTVVLLALAISSASHSSAGCEAPMLPSLIGRAGFQPTTQPFDRERGCYVGEPLLAADPWPGTTEGGSSAELPPSAAPSMVR